MAERILAWGVLGTGRIARLAMLPALRRLRGARVVAIASTEASRAEAVATHYGIPRAYGSYQALLEDAEVACVYIALPNHLHGEWTERALAAGKHVLCEKPLGCSAAEAAAMAQASLTTGKALMEAFMYRFHPRTQRLLDLVATDAIGAVREVEAAFTFLLAAEDNYRLRPEAGGGALLDVGVYCVVPALLAFGGEPVRATAQAEYGPTGIDQHLEGTLEWADGRVARLTCGLRGPEQQELRVRGSEGELRVPYPAFAGGLADAAPVIVKRHGLVEELPGPPADPFALEAEQFGAAVVAGTPVPYPLAMTLTCARALDALAAAARTGTPQPVAPAPRV